MFSPKFIFSPFCLYFRQPFHYFPFSFTLFLYLCTCWTDALLYYLFIQCIFPLSCFVVSFNKLSISCFLFFSSAQHVAYCSFSVFLLCFNPHLIHSSFYFLLWTFCISIFILHPLPQPSRVSGLLHFLSTLHLGPLMSTCRVILGTETKRKALSHFTSVHLYLVVLSSNFHIELFPLFLLTRELYFI